MQINVNETTKLVGIASTDLNTIGTCEFMIELDNVLLKHKFHIVSAYRLHLSQDAILGTDFFKQNKLIIDYSKESFVVLKQRSTSPKSTVFANSSA